MRNLLKETNDILGANGKSAADVRWVGAPKASFLIGIGTPKSPIPFGSWSDFEKFANFEYDAGYGGTEVNGDLVIVGDDWWLERGEYDGSEWWEFKTIPAKPHDPTPLRPSDLRDS